MSSVVSKIMQMMGYTLERFAQEAAQRGFGDASQIQQALARGDVSMFQGYAQHLAQNNPQLAAQAQSQCAGLK